MIKNLRIEIKWAIYFILMTLAWMVLERISGLHDRYIDYQPYLTNLFAIPAIWFMVKALKDKKKNYYQGQMSYLQGFISGLYLSIFITLLSPLMQWITSYVITPDYFKNAIKRSVELGYYKTTADAAAYFNFKNYVISATLGAFVMGIVTVAIAMIFIRSKAEKKTDN